MRAALAWFDQAHGLPTVCMIEDGHTGSQGVAAKLGFTEYARHQPDEGRGLVMYERDATSRVRSAMPA